MSKYVVIFWKTLYDDKVRIADFDDEHEVTEFAENKRMNGYCVILSEKLYSLNNEVVHKIRRYGAYPFYANIYQTIGLILLGIIIFVFLFWKLSGFR